METKDYNVIYNTNFSDGNINGYISLSGLSNQKLSAYVVLEDDFGKCFYYRTDGVSKYVLTANVHVFDTDDTGIFGFVVCSNGYNDLSTKLIRYQRNIEITSYTAITTKTEEILQTKRESWIAEQKTKGRKGISEQDYSCEWYSTSMKSGTQYYICKYGTWRPNKKYSWEKV